jgi:hypothetical protein
MVKYIKDLDPGDRFFALMYNWLTKETTECEFIVMDTSRYNIEFDRDEEYKVCINLENGKPIAFGLNDQVEVR